MGNLHLRSHLEGYGSRKYHLRTIICGGYSYPLV